MTDWSSWLTRWTEAGVIDADTAGRIRAYEAANADPGRLRWPVVAALAGGGLMLGGGVLLFVAAHWDTLSPAIRFALVLAMVGGFHVAAALVGDRFHALSVTLHVVGTVALGGGIALAGQIFNMAEHWPAGFLMWAVGAAAGWAILRQSPQAALLALLVPVWLAGEWTVATHSAFLASSARVLATGAFLTAVTYFTLPGAQRHTPAWQRAVHWIGGIALLPAGFVLAEAASRSWRTDSALTISTGLAAVGWVVAIGAPLLLALAVRRFDAWPQAAAAAWTVTLLFTERAAGELAFYAWWALGGVALASWGVRDGRTERVNMGATVFALTVVAFYFSNVMDKLGRSAGLIGLGLMFLAGGWALERLRRRLVARAQEAA